MNVGASNDRSDAGVGILSCLLIDDPILIIDHLSASDSDRITTSSNAVHSIRPTVTTIGRTWDDREMQYHLSRIAIPACALKSTHAWITSRADPIDFQGLHRLPFGHRHKSDSDNCT